VSFKFFKDIYEKDLNLRNDERKTFRGHFIYAIDGDHLDLPASEDVFINGYCGYVISKKEETHYPKMYTVQAVDLVNGMVSKFSYSNELSELRQARRLVKELEKNSIVIYDRLHQTYETAYEHEQAGNYFFVRVKTKNEIRVPLPIQDFCRSNRKSKWIDLEPSVPLKRKQMPALRVRLIKIKNKNTKEIMVFMTNAPEDLIKKKEVGEFYQRRWGVESSFKDLTDTLKMCQWHTTKFNGVLQEIYALLWLVNNVKRVCSSITRTARKWLEPIYKKSNFKLSVTVFIDHLDLLIKGKHTKLHRILSYWVSRTAEKRCHLSRSYPRQVKRYGKRYANASRVDRRPNQPTERH
jgi:hypothetical protein